MPDVYTGQDFRLTLNTRISLEGATMARILYIKPDGATGYWTATVAGKAVHYDIEAIDQSGVWTFQAYVVVNGQARFGKKTRKRILKAVQ
jgi:hypothetical protein